MMRRAFVLVAMLALSLGSGCNQYMWWDYRDDPYMADMANRGTTEVLRNISSTNPQERQVALRILADSAGDARRRGSGVEADRLESLIIRRYFQEKEAAVRACIVRICAPLVGYGSRQMPEFLRGRIAAGEYPGYAALSLAALAVPNAFIDIEPLTRHPAPEVRYQAAIALVVLADPRGFEAVCRVWRGMHSQAWPAIVEGMTLIEARDALALRARRGFGRPLY